LSSATSMRSLMAGLLPFLNRYWALTLKEEWLIRASLAP
jgi:hypothetical protein